MSDGASALVVEWWFGAEIDQSLPDVAWLQSLCRELFVWRIEDFIKDGNRLELQEVVPRVELNQMR